MSSILLLSLAAFLAALLFALAVTAWTNNMRRAVAEVPVAHEAPPVMVTIIVPARNEERNIAGVLQDLHVQRYPKELLEVIVVDDHGSDGTAAIVQAMLPKWPGLRLLRNAGNGKKAAIAHAVREARSDLLLMTDADARCGPLRVQQLVRSLQEAPAELVLMPVATQGNGTWPGRVQVDEQAALLGAAIGSAHGGMPLLAYGANMAFSKAAFVSVGGFDGEKWTGGDDMFLLRRMQRAGMRVRFVAHPELTVHVVAEHGLACCWRQRLRWAGKMRGVGGAGIWAGAAALLLPWFLAYATLHFDMRKVAGQGLVRSLALLCAAWMLWAAPIMALVKQTKRNFLPNEAAKSGVVIASLFSLIAFAIYAPLVAVISLFHRPLWKGRRMK